jgi:DNA-binding beta-propeller fold protein YncE
MCFDGMYLYTAEARWGSGHLIYKLDPITGNVVQTYPEVSTFTTGFAWDGTNFYMSGDQDPVIYVTDTSFVQARTLPVPEKWCRDMAWDGTYLWLVTSYTNKVWKLQSSNGTVVSSFSAPEDFLGGLACDGNYLWIVWGNSYLQTNRISKVNPASGGILKTYQGPGSRLTGLAWDNGCLWCLDWETDTIYKLAVPLEVDIDIKPQTCPNPLNVKSKSVLPVAVLGSEDFDVSTIDVASIRLAGVAPIRSSYEDVTTPVSDANECECSTEDPDGFPDLTLKFETQRIVEALGKVNHGDELVLELTGVLSDETPIEGSDCVIIRGKHKPINKADFNSNG